jgi:hypothetical protein
VDENMKKAQKRNAILTEKFWFRNDLQNKDNKAYSLMTVNEIINGKDVCIYAIRILFENILICKMIHRNSLALFP